MNAAKVIHIETANPESRWTQDEILQSVAANEKIEPKAGIFYRKFLSDKAIQTRHLGVSALSEVNEESPDAANERFTRVATDIGRQAVERCLAAAGLKPEEVDGLIVTTCTGYLCPGLTSYISEAVGLRDDLYAVDLAGLGCGAAIPALRAADQYLRVHEDSNVIVLSVEVCSAALSWGNEIDLILSNSIFADGAAACLVSNKAQFEGAVMKGFDSLLWPEYRDDLRFKKKDSRLCNVINKNVPEIAAEAVRFLHGRLAVKAGGPIHHYGVHPGGRRILDEVENGLQLAPETLKRSREVLYDYGNMSSPSILYVLKKILEQDTADEGEQIALFAFGAGFSAYGTLLQTGKNIKEKVRHEL